MEVKVTKLTDESLLHIANSFTTGKESKQTLKSAYRNCHTTIRTQLFLVECYGIPQYVAYHFRTHFTLYPMAPQEYGWMRSKRIDRGGADFRDVCAAVVKDIIGIADGEITDRHEVLGIARAVEEMPLHFDRMAKTDFGFMVSAEGLMLMAEKRLCTGCVAKETREVMEAICQAVKNVDPDLYPYLVKPCISHGGICRNKPCCGFNKTELFTKLLNQYKSLFV